MRQGSIDDTEAEFRGVQKEAINYDIVDRGIKKTQGTYVCPSDGLGLCDRYELVGLKKRLLTAMKK